MVERKNHEFSHEAMVRQCLANENVSFCVVHLLPPLVSGV